MEITPFRLLDDASTPSHTLSLVVVADDVLMIILQIACASVRKGLTRGSIVNR